MGGAAILAVACAAAGIQPRALAAVAYGPAGREPARCVQVRSAAGAAGAAGALSAHAERVGWEERFRAPFRAPRDGEGSEGGEGGEHGPGACEGSRGEDRGAATPRAAAPGDGGPEAPAPAPGDGGPGLLAAVGRGMPLGAAQRVQARTAASALGAYAERLARAEQRRVAAAAEWDLDRAPLLAPPPPGPGEKPELETEPGHLSGRGLPPVITRVPTDEKVVFLTIDDGAEKDPELLKMLRDLQIPVTGFLSDYVARDDYDYFRRAHDEGADIHNHSINHREMPSLSYAEQRREICRQQDVLAREIGERPTLFRPPYGAYDRDTLRAAAECGVEVVPLWAAEAFPDRIEWARPDLRLHSGDIILTHFRGPAEWDGTMTDMLRRVLDTVTRQGFALARLDDYL